MRIKCFESLNKAKNILLTIFVLFVFTSFVFPWESQLFPFNAGTGKYEITPVNFNSRTWKLLDYSYVGYNLGQTPLQTAIPCNVQTIIGTGDITQELQDKINSVGASGGGIVKIPAGTYTITSTSNGKTIGINYNNVSVEGAGSGYTVLNVPATHSYNEDANAFEGTFSIEQGYFAWNKGWSDPGSTLCTVNNTINEGDTYITGLSNLASVNTGDWVLIIQYYWSSIVANNGGTGIWSVCPTTCGGNPGREYAFSYLRKIVSKDASGITVDAPIPYTLNPANNPINIKPSGPVTGGMIQNCGVSGMTIKFADNNNSVTQARPSGCAVYFEGAVNCWVKDVYIYNFPRYGICVEYSARISVVDSKIENAQDTGGGGNGYGFFTTCSQNILYKNCTGISARHNFIASRAITSYVVMTHCKSIDSREGEDSHFSLLHAILRDDYYQSNGNDLNGYNRGSTSAGAYESYLHGVLWNCAGDGYSGIYYGGTINITPSSDGYALIVGGPDKHIVYDGSYYDAGGTYHPGDIMSANPGLQAGPGPNGTRKNVLYEGLGSTGLQPQSLYEEQLKNRVGTVSAWANVCAEVPTNTAVPTNTPVLTPGILVYDSDHPAWGAGMGGAAPTMLNTLTPGNNLDDLGQNRTINGKEAIRYTSTGSDWGVLTQFGGPNIQTSLLNKLDFWVYPTNINLNFRMQLSAGVTDLGNSVIVNGTFADGGVFTINSWNHVAIPMANFGYNGSFNGLDLRNNTTTVNNTFWLDDIYFLPLAMPTLTNTNTCTATPSTTSTNSWTKTLTAASTTTASATFTAVLNTATPTFTLTVSAGRFGSCNKVILAYYYNDGTMPYKADKIPYDKLTHICHSFVVPNADGSLNVPAGFLEPLLISNAHAAGIKVLISAGGGGTYAACSAMANSPSSRNTFENNIVSFIQSNGYDGVDIDWEGMINAADRANYTSLLTELRAKFNSSQPPGTNWLITAAVPLSSYWGQWIDYPSIVSSVDYFNLMNYDMHGGWGDHMGYNAPLYPNPSDLDTMSDVMGVDYMIITRGVPASKVVMGVPFYGYNFLNLSAPFQSCGGTCGDANVTYLDYNIISTSYIGNGWTYHWDAVSHVPYLTNDAGTGIITYDNPQSIAEKITYALTTRGLGGVMMWDLSADYIPWLGQPLMDSMFNAFMAACPSGFTATPTFTISPTYTATPVWPSTIIYDGDTTGSKITDGVITNSANGGGLTQAAGGNVGNAMLVTYVDSAWYSSHTWQLNSARNIAGYNYLQFDIKSAGGYVDDFNFLMNWTKGAVNILNYSSIGIPPYWVTIQIPLADLLMPSDTQVTFIAFQKLINYPYSVMVDNIKLINMTAPTPSPTQQNPTVTYTRTNSPSETSTCTVTSTSTSTCTATCTATTEPVFTASPTSTQSLTETVILSATSSPTVLLSSTATFTITCTLTGTITLSSTQTAVNTQLNTVTASCTKTFTPTLSLTITETAVITPATTPPDVEKNPYPNPVNPDKYDLFIGVLLADNADEVVFKLYTVNSRLVRRVSFGYLTAGAHLVKVDRGYLMGLSSGVYYYIIDSYMKIKNKKRSGPYKIIVIH
jgi:chitinase